MYQDILVPNLGAGAVEKAFQDALNDNEALFYNNREMLVDFYLSQQTDKDEYLKDYFNLETDPNRGADYPHNLILTQVNVTAKVIDKKAKSYLKQPVRYIDGVASKQYDDILLASGIKTASKLMDRLTWLLGDHCTIIIADKDKQKLRFDQPAYYIPVFGSGDMVNPIGVAYPSGTRINARGETIAVWEYWDERNHFVFENGSWNILSEESNPHGVFNALFTHRLKPFRGHWTKDAQDLIDNNRDINIAMTAVNNAFRYQGFPNLIFLGLNESEAKNIKIGFGKAITLSAGEAQDKMDAKYLNAGVDWRTLIETIKARIEMITATWNVDIRWDLSRNVSSGIALKILSVDNLDDLSEILELYEEYFEVPLFEKIKAISSNISWLNGLSGNKLTLDWPEFETIESSEERMVRLETNFKYNLSNPIREIMRDNPDLSEIEATEQYKKNTELNEELRAMLKEDTDDILKALDTNE